MSPAISLRSTASDTSSRATRPPKVRVTCSTERRGATERHDPKRKAGGGPNWGLARVFEEAVRERVPHELGTCAQIQLPHDLGSVRLGRSDRDEQQLCDLLVRVAESQQSHHLALAIGQWV